MTDKYKELLRPERLQVKQVLEGFELVLGWESRNKYRILDSHGKKLGFAAEESSGLLGTLLRGVLKHWRSFKIIVFNEEREPALSLYFPFRFFWKTLEVRTADGQNLGAVQQRFGILTKKFDVHDAHGKPVAQIRSGLFKLWTFEFTSHGRHIGSVKKQWSGALGEIFTDKDNFEVNFDDPTLSPEIKAVMLATSLMIDLVYFENNQGLGPVADLLD